MEALTVKTFKTNKISATDVSKNRSKEFNYKSVKFSYDGKEIPPIRIDGNFKLFKFKNKSGNIHSLSIRCDSANELSLTSSIK